MRFKAKDCKQARRARWDGAAFIGANNTPGSVDQIKIILEVEWDKIGTVVLGSTDER